MRSWFHRRDLLIAAPALAAAALAPRRTFAQVRPTLGYAPARVDNPLKGLVPYIAQGRDHFPYSMEFNYLPLSALMLDDAVFDWSSLDEMITAVAQRGNHTVFRVFMEYPGRSDGIPGFLRERGLRTIVWRLDDGAGPRVETPDYGNPDLQRALVTFIAALGARYDGDRRVGFVTAGLLGLWGEWHCWPRIDLFAPKPLQTVVMDAFQQAFRRTPVLLRYPAGPADANYADNSARPFGYHDDSFAYSTLELTPDQSWHFMALMRRAGPRALDRWKTRPIGGEIRPKVWGLIFDADPADPNAQDFDACVAATHATWLLDSGMFNGRQSNARIERASAAVRRMGYEFHAREAAFSLADPAAVRVSAVVENRGAAPLYASWQTQFALINARRALSRAAGSASLVRLLPGSRRTITASVGRAGLTAGRYAVGMRVVNPLPGGKPLTFANSEQDLDAAGWLTLGEVQL